MIAAVAIGFVAAAIAGFILCQPEGEAQKEGTSLFRFGKARKKQPASQAPAESAEDVPEAGNADGGNIHREPLMAVAEGEVVQLSQVKIRHFPAGPWERG